MGIEIKDPVTGITDIYKYMDRKFFCNKILSLELELYFTGGWTYTGSEFNRDPQILFFLF